MHDTNRFYHLVSCITFITSSIGFLTESLCNDSYVSVVNPLIAPYSLIDAII